MFQRIIVPLDGSALAEATIPYAEGLARDQNTEIILVQAIANAAVQRETRQTGHAGFREAERLSHNMEELARTYLSSQAEVLQRKGLRVRWEVVLGEAADAITKAAREVNADAIIISTHGASGLGRVIFGSVADKLIRQSAIPVLVIRPQATRKGGA